MQFLRLEVTLHTLVVARSGNPPACFAFVKNNLLLTECTCVKFEDITKLPYLSYMLTFTSKKILLQKLNRVIEIDADLVANMSNK